MTRVVRRSWRHAGSSGATPAGALPTAIVAAVAAIYTVQHPGAITLSTSAATTNEPSVLVSGTVANPRVTEVQLIANGVVRSVTVQEGVFATEVAMLPGNNSIQAVVAGAIGNLFAGSDLVRVDADIPVLDVWAELSWDGEGDIDLHLYLPNGEHCYYQQPNTPSGAVLDVDNRERDGPEHISLETGMAGSYRVSVVYYAANPPNVAPPRPVPWQVTVRLRGEPAPRLFAGVLTAVDEEQTVYTFDID